MVFELVVPEVDKKGSCKDFVIELFTENWPLSLKEIYNHIKKDFKYSGSYQSVFKSVNELLDKKVLIRKGNLYELNISWVKKLQSFTDIVETNYYVEKKNGTASKENKMVVLNFNNLFDAEKYLYYFIKNELKKMKSEKVVYESNHLWKILFYYRAEYNYYTKLMKSGHEFFILYSGKSLIEENAKEIYKKIGVKVKKKKESSPVDTIVFGNYYIQIFIPEILKEKIETYLNNGKDFELIKILDEDYSIKVIIHKEEDLAKNLKEKFLKKF